MTEVTVVWYFLSPYLTLTLTAELIPLAESHYYALKVTHNKSPVTGGGGGAILFRSQLCQISAGPCSAAGTLSIFSLNLGPSLGIIRALSTVTTTSSRSLGQVSVCWVIISD